MVPLFVADELFRGLVHGLVGHRAPVDAVRVAIVIVGASVAGVRTAQALRGQGFDGTLTVIGEERHHPYDKPPLSKEMLVPSGEGAPVPLLSSDELASFDVRLGTRATGLDPERRVVLVESGDEIPFTRLVIATGVTPRTLPGAPAGVYTLRCAEDAQALRAELKNASRAVVIGAGFIGAEFASAAIAHGVHVSIVEAQDTPMAHILGAEVGGMLAKLHELNGVEVHAGARFDRFEGGARVSGVALADGRVLQADLVVVGIGARPATDWLAGSGLPVDDGVVCDEKLRVRGFPGIYAAGDVARWPHPHYSTDLRIEHWTNAGEHGTIVAADILGKPAPRPQVPYVWSDQYGRRIQIVGRPAAGRPAFVDGSVEEERFMAVYADGESVVGALVVDDPRAMMKCRKAIAGGLNVDDLRGGR